MIPAWRYYSRRRGVTIDALIQGGVSAYAELVSYCNQIGVQVPEEELFDAALKRSRPAETAPTVVVESPKTPAVEKKPVRKRPALKGTRRKKAGT